MVIHVDMVSVGSPQRVPPIDSGSGGTVGDSHHVVVDITTGATGFGLDGTEASIWAGVKTTLNVGALGTGQWDVHRANQVPWATIYSAPRNSNGGISIYLLSILTSGGEDWVGIIVFEVSQKVVGIPTRPH